MKRDTRARPSEGGKMALAVGMKTYYTIVIQSTAKGLGGGEAGPRVPPTPGYNLLVFMQTEEHDEDKTVDEHFDTLEEALDDGASREMNFQEHGSVSWEIEGVSFSREGFDD